MSNKRPRWELYATYCDRSMSYPCILCRLKVPGGWLVARNETDDMDEFQAAERPTPDGGVVFVPDPRHKWSASKPIKQLP